MWDESPFNGSVEWNYTFHFSEDFEINGGTYVAHDLDGSKDTIEFGVHLHYKKIEYIGSTAE